MPELLWARGGGGMPELSWAHGQYAGTFGGSSLGVPELLWAQGGGMSELLWA